jgi:hypothetical protein
MSVSKRWVERAGLRHAVFPPTAGAAWQLDAAASHGELAIDHPLLSTRRYPLELLTGTLTGRLPDQADLRLRLVCAEERNGSRVPVYVTFMSRQIIGSAGYGYCLKGELQTGEPRGDVVIVARDLGWTAARDRAAVRRIVTLTASLEKKLWQMRALAQPPLLTRSTATLFLHTEWMIDEPATAA